MPADDNDRCRAPQWQHLQENGLVHRFEIDGHILRGYDQDGHLVFVDRDITLVTTDPVLKAFEGLECIPDTRIWRRAA